MVIQDFKVKTKDLIDGLKGICIGSYGLGSEGSLSTIITQVFLYKFINDKFGYEVKKIDEKLAKAEIWEQTIAKYTDEEYEMLLMQMPPDSARLQREHYISYLFQSQDKEEYAKLFDDTLREIAILNNDIFSVKSDGGNKLILFDKLSEFIKDNSKRDAFCKAIINKIVEFSFEKIFNQKFDFFADIFEYLIKDYNKNNGGTYAEYYTPHAVAKIIAAILVDSPVQNVTCYDPAAGTGTLLMNLAHAIGEDRCTIYTQDISQKSSGMLRLNLILNNLVHSIQNVIEGNTIVSPFHKDSDGKLMKFDYIVSNPPFKLNFSDYHAEIDTEANNNRFFAGIPNILDKDKDKMSIYLLFIQHIMYSLNDTGKAAIVVPTGFITAQTGIERKIREKLINERMLRGVVSMPSNIFAATGTNVSILFLDKANKKGDIVLMDASKLGEITKEDKNQKTVLSEDEEKDIINTFNLHETVDDFSVLVSYEKIIEKNYSFSAGQYFDVKISQTYIAPEEFKKRMDNYQTNLNTLFAESRNLEEEIQDKLESLRFAAEIIYETPLN